jgi:hypothetical protein
MAKKSKIARNEQRKVVVERYAAKRAQLKKQTDALVEFSLSLALAVFASARWHTRENFLVSPSLLGKKV